MDLSLLQFCSKNVLVKKSSRLDLSNLCSNLKWCSKLTWPLSTSSNLTYCTHLVSGWQVQTLPVLIWLEQKWDNKGVFMHLAAAVIKTKSLSQCSIIWIFNAIQYNLIEGKCRQINASLLRNVIQEAIVKRPWIKVLSF